MLIRGLLAGLFLLVILYLPAYALPERLPLSPSDIERFDIEGAIEHLSKDHSGLLSDYLSYFRTVQICRTSTFDACTDALDWFESIHGRSLSLLYDLILYRLTLLEQEIENSGSSLRADLVGEFKRYYDRYRSAFPEDRRVVFLYGRVLEQTGHKGRALRIYKRLILDGDRYYFKLRRHLKEIPLKVTELLRLSENLIKGRYFDEAEGILFGLLQRKPPYYVRDIYRLLGDIAFSKKDYQRATRYLLRGGELYRTAVSFYRAGDYGRFEEIARRLVHEESEEGCRIGLLRGLYRRRSGEFADAIDRFGKIYRSNRLCKEDALWQRAWAEYLSGSLQIAYKDLKSLYSISGRTRYLYWLDRASEKLGRGDDVRAFLLGGIPVHESFYAALYQFRKPFTAMRMVSLPVVRSEEKDLQGMPAELEKTFQRVKLLSEMGLGYFASREVRTVNAEDDGERIFLCRAFLKAGAYDEVVRCADGLSDGSGHLELLYPVAYRDIVLESSMRVGVSPALVLAVMREESRFMEDAVSPAGAVGLMQLMPGTAERILRSKGLFYEMNPDNLTDPALNIFVGTAYLGDLIDEFGELATAVAAYNAGEDRVEEWLRNYHYGSIDEFIEDIPFRETRYYVMRVLKSYLIYSELLGLRSRQPF